MTNPAATVLVTGASHGIGRAISLALARSGFPVLGVSRTPPEDRPDPARSSEHTSVQWKELDLSNAADVERCVSSLEAVPIRFLILSAVDYGPGQRHPAAEISAQEWQQVVGTNCIGHAILVSRLLPKLAANPPGIIVNISSDVAISPAAGRAAYAASKAGLHAMLRAVAAEKPVECLRIYQLIPTFQVATRGLRRRRAPDFDFSSYGDPAVMGAVVERLVSPSDTSRSPGTYLVRQDGTLEPYSEPSRV